MTQPGTHLDRPRRQRLLFRTVQLFFTKDLQSGLVWLTKFLTDPFHDIYLDHKALLRLLRGALIDPQHAQHRH